MNSIQNKLSKASLAAIAPVSGNAGGSRCPRPGFGMPLLLAGSLLAGSVLAEEARQVVAKAKAPGQIQERGEPAPDGSYADGGGVALGRDATAIGSGAQALASGASAFGALARADKIAASAFGSNARAADTNSTATGANAQALTAAASAFGANAQARANAATALGYDAKVRESANDSVALGARSEATARNAVALGAGSVADRAGTVSVGRAGVVRQIVQLAAGTEATDAVNKAQLDALSAAVGMASHYFKATGTQSGDDDASAEGRDTTAAGRNSKASGSGATAMGAGSFADGMDSSAFGQGAVASGAQSTALGYGSSAQGVGGLAIGASIARGKHSVAIGTDNVVDTFYATALGSSSRIERDSWNSVAIGHEVVVFRDAPAAVAIGTGARIGSNGVGGVALGLLAQVEGLRSIAIGASARTDYGDGQSVYQPTLAKGAFATVLGSAALVTADRATALGFGAYAPAAGAVALGARSIADRADTVSVGRSGYDRQITHVAAGNEDMDAVNLAQLREAGRYFKAGGAAGGHDEALADGPYATSSGAGSYAAGEGASAYGSGANALDAQSMALGYGAVAWSAGSLAIGAAASTVDDDAVAVGTLANASGAGAMALGARAQAAEVDALALGVFSTASNEFSSALGFASTASGDSATAVGASSVAQGEESLALGTDSYAEMAGSIALGAHSRADRAGAVSVGQAGEERQIIHVAPGTADTDAVNLRQLQEAVDGSGVIGRVVRYDNTEQARITLDGAAGTTLDHVRAGVVAGGSKEAVNGGQLFEHGDQMAQSLGGGAMMTGGGLSGPLYAIQGSRYYNIGDAFSAVDGKLGELDYRVNRLERAKSVKGADLQLRSPSGSPQSVVPLPESATLAPHASTSPASTPAVPAAAAPAVVSNVAKGAAPTDAANVSQIQEALVTARQYSDGAARQAASEAKAYTDQRTAGLVANADFDAFKSDVDTRFNALATRLDRVGAMGTALAGMAGAIASAAGSDSRVSAAVGGYRGQGALAVGFARRIPGNGAVLLGGSIAGGGESSGTLGVSFGW